MGIITTYCPLIHFLQQGELSQMLRGSWLLSPEEGKFKKIIIINDLFYRSFDVSILQRLHCCWIKNGYALL